VSEYRKAAVRISQSIATRRYLLGAMLAWVLIVYLVPGPGPSRSSAPSPAPAAQSAPPAGPTAPTAGPDTSLLGSDYYTPPPSLPPLGPDLSAPVARPASAVGFTSPSFTAPPPPPATVQLSCPYPIPQAQNAPLSPGVLLSFLTPLGVVAGPFADYDLPILGAIGPVLPIILPIFSVAQPVMNAITPELSVVITDLSLIEDTTGLGNNPQEVKFAAQFKPAFIKFLNSLIPVEQQLASASGTQCLILFENELAQMAAKVNL